MNRFLSVMPVLLAGFVLAAVVAVQPAFHRAGYWLLLPEQYFAPAILAIALTPVMVTGGIDLSIGSVTVFASVVAGWLWRDCGWPIEVALLGGMLAGLGAGATNGGLVRLGVLPLVATLATRELFRGLALALGGDNPVTRFPTELGTFWRTPVLGLPLSLWIIAMVAVIGYFVVHQSWFGRVLFAMGDNETAARFAALPVKRVKFGAYAVCGLAAGLCGAALVCRFGAAKADAEKSLELTAIACVVLGGVRVTGGAGHIGGTLLGVVTVAALQSGLNEAFPQWRDTITGALLISVALINEAAARWSRGRGYR